MGMNIQEDFFEPKNSIYTSYEDMTEEQLTEQAKQGDTEAMMMLLDKKFGPPAKN